MLGVRHPLKHRRFRAGGTEVIVEAGGASSSGQAVAEARDVGEATAAAAATATAVGAPKESDRVDEVGYMCGGWKRCIILKVELFIGTKSWCGLQGSGVSTGPMAPELCKPHDSSCRQGSGVSTGPTAPELCKPHDSSCRQKNLRRTCPGFFASNFSDWPWLFLENHAPVLCGRMVFLGASMETAAVSFMKITCCFCDLLEHVDQNRLRELCFGLCL